MYPETHRFIIEHALQFRRKHFKGYEKVITDASVNEDFPRISFKAEDLQLFGWDHFYHPKKGGYFTTEGNAKKRGMMLFKRAVEFYKQGKKREALLTLGRCTHYLADVASPSHTKLQFHLVEDDFERYCDQNLHRFRFKIRAKMVPPLQPEDCFENLARRSNRVKYKKKNWVIEIFTHFFKQKIQKDPDKRLNRLSKKLIKLSIIYTIALLNSFNRKIIKYRWQEKRKKIVGKVQEKKKKIVVKVKDKRKKIVRKIKKKGKELIES